MLNRLIYDDVINDVEIDSNALVEGLSHLCLYDVPGRMEECENGFINHLEVQFIADVIRFLLDSGVPGSTISVVTNYDAQARALRSKLLKIGFHDQSELECVSICAHAQFTREKRKVLIYSVVGLAPSLGHPDMSDVIKTLSYAISHAMIFGNVTNLLLDKSWQKLIDYLRTIENGIQTSFQLRKLMGGYYSIRTDSNEFIPADALPGQFSPLRSVIADRWFGGGGLHHHVDNQTDHYFNDDGDDNDDHQSLDREDDDQSEAGEKDNSQNCEKSDEEILLVRHKRNHVIIDDDDHNDEVVL